MEIKDFLYFDKMIVPKIITWVYWAQIAIIVLFTVSRIIADFGVFVLISSVVLLPLAILGARISCELAIVLFKIHETLQAKNLKQN